MRMIWRVAKRNSSGKKAYAVGALMVATGLATMAGYAAFLPAPMVPADPVTLILDGLGLIMLRAGVAKAANGNGMPKPSEPEITPTNPGDRIRARHARERAERG